LYLFIFIYNQKTSTIRFYQLGHFISTLLPHGYYMKKNIHGGG